MIIIRVRTNYCDGLAYFIIDTNGEKGYTRINMKTMQVGAGSTSDCDLNNLSYSYKFNNPSIIVEDNKNAPVDNLHSDITIFAVDMYTHSVKALDQRTRNIIVTGNFMISQ